MKATGIVRKIDDLGRIVLPVETRKVLGIRTKDPIEIFTEEDMIILKKWEPTCTFCGSKENVTEYNGKKICKTCCNKIGDKFED